MKRLFDVLVSAVALLVLSPLILLLALFVRLGLGSPVLFAQERVGRNSRPFTIVKFRTMTNATDHNGQPLSDANRLTRFGAWLRKTSCDELPELWNVLKGDMSLVGPRPLLPRYLPYFTETEARRHDVRPGITGLAQVSGRNFLSWNERLALDVEYVEQQSLWLDLKIMLLTVKKVVTFDDVAEDTGAVMMDLDDERRSSGNVPRH